MHSLQSVLLILCNSQERRNKQVFFITIIILVLVQRLFKQMNMNIIQLNQIQVINYELKSPSIHKIKTKKLGMLCLQL